MDLRLSYNFRWTSETYVDNLLMTLRDRGGFGKVAFWLFENNMLQSVSRKTFLSWRELKLIAPVKAGKDGRKTFLSWRELKLIILVTTSGRFLMDLSFPSKKRGKDVLMGITSLQMGGDLSSYKSKSYALFL